MASLLTVVVNGRVATLEINDVQRRNALSADLLREIHSAIDEVDADAFVLTAAGRYFCAGADVEELRSGSWRRETPNGPPLLFRRITADPRPFIAAVNGPAFGGGCELALSCDFLAMADEALLELPEASLGVVPNSAVGLLAGTLPKHLLMQFLTGRLRLDLQQARALGLVALHAPAEAISAKASEYVRGILAHCSPSAFRLIKSAVAERDSGTWGDMARLLAATEDCEVSAGLNAMRTRERFDYTTYWTKGGRGR